MDLNRIIKEKVLDRADRPRLRDCIGELIDYNEETRTAKVSISNQIGKGEYILNTVRYLSDSMSSKMAILKKGDLVSIVFEDGMINTAKLVGVIKTVRRENQDNHKSSSGEMDILDDSEYEKIDLLSITDGSNMSGALLSFDYQKELIEDEDYQSKITENEVGFSNRNYDSIIKIDKRGNIVLSNSIKNKVVLKTDGDIEITARKIIYK